MIGVTHCMSWFINYIYFFDFGRNGYCNPVVIKTFYQRRERKNTKLQKKKSSGHIELTQSINQSISFVPIVKFVHNDEYDITSF